MNSVRTQAELNSLLWKAACNTYGVISPINYKDYVLPLLFFKYMSDNFKAKKKAIEAKFPDKPTRVENLLREEARFYLEEGYTFDCLVKDKNKDNLGQRINEILHHIEDNNQEKLENVFRHINFNNEHVLGERSTRNRMLRELIETFDKVDLSTFGDDIIGNAYMYLIQQFGSDAKKGGEFFTPQCLADLLVRLGDPKKGAKICDPTCGSGGLLLLAGQHIIDEEGVNDFSLFGQEQQSENYNLCRINMFLHNYDSAKIVRGDTLKTPKLTTETGLETFDLVLANPPFSVPWEAPEEDKYNRYHRGDAPKTKADYAFISHMIETAKRQEGRVAVIVPHGVLFRGAVEGRIRKQLIEENLLDAVIGVPSNLFQTVSIPVAILLFDRSREKGGAREHEKDVLFIDASKDFIPGKNQNTLSDEQVDRIVNAYKARETEDKFASKVSFEEIKENDFNLNIPRYVDTFEEEEIIDLKDAWEDVQKIEEKVEKCKANLMTHLKKFEGVM